MMAATFEASGAEPALLIRDGRFIMLRRGTHGGYLRAVIDWTEELKQVPAAGGVQRGDPI